MTQIFNFFRKNSAYDYWIAFFLVFSIFFIRGGDRILHPSLYAEDGVWISEALKHGFLYTLAPYDGYHLFFQKLTCWLVIQLPVYLWPLAMNLFCFFVYAAVFSVFAKSEFEDLLSSRSDRIIACLLLSFLPGLYEILGNSANLGGALNLFVAFVYLKKPGKSPSILEILLVLVFMASTGLTSSLLPLLFYRLILARKTARISGGEFQRYGFLMGAQFLFIGLNILARQDENRISHLNWDLLADLWRSWGFGSLNGILLQPFFGSHWTHLIGNFAGLFWPIALFVFAAFLHVIVHQPRKQRLLSAMIASWSSAVLLTCMVRGWGVVHFGHRHYREMNTCRYSFVLAPAGLFLALSLISFFQEQMLRGKFKQGIPIYALVYFLLNATGDPFKIPSLVIHPEKAWQAFAPALDSSLKTGCPKQITVPIEPGNWKIWYQSPKEANCAFVGAR